MTTSTQFIGICSLGAGIMFCTTPVSASFHTTTNGEQAKWFFDINEAFKTVDTAKQHETSVQFELQSIQYHYMLEYGQPFPVQAATNARIFLDNIIYEHLPIPHIAANALGQVGLTWDSDTHRIYLAIDSNGELFLTCVNRKNLNEYNSMQRNIGARDEVVKSIKTVL